MLNKEKKQILDQFITSLTKPEIAWVSGYLAGLVAEEISAISNNKIVKDLTILYITETGNSKFLASEIAKKLKAEGSNSKLKSVEQYRFTDLVKEKNLLIIASTHGEGEIPQSGKKFYEYINQNELDLKNLNYFVIALGDTNYPLFCQSGKDIDLRLEKLNAKKLAPRIDLDLDFENSINQVYAQVSAAFAEGGAIASVQNIKPAKSGQNQFVGEILANINLNDVGSSKETRHIEIAASGADDLHYEAGDSVGILFENEELKVEGKITPRLYSIASSLNEHGSEVHLTVSVLRYIDKDGKEVEGLFSGHLAHLQVGSKIKFYISKNRQFKLPKDDQDIIMVGPGTGVAPFRAFLAERNYRNASGKNWLFFGERNFQSDFLYQIEWQAHLESGLLSKMSVAFSRDQKEKIYVQDRIKENAKELYQWLENGAYFYVCGDKENMARDVENSLLEVIENEGNKNREQAQEYLSNLIEQDRYLRDVY